MRRNCGFQQLDIRYGPDDNDIYGQGVTLTANWQQGCSSCIPWLSAPLPLPTTDHSRLPLQQGPDKDGDNDQDIEDGGDEFIIDDQDVDVENDHEHVDDDQNVEDDHEASILAVTRLNVAKC